MRVAVVGAGVVGLSTTASLLERGVDAACYERLDVVMSERSAGSSRIFRLAHPTPDLVRLAQSARVGFREWEKTAGTPMISTSGCVISGDNAPGWATAMKQAAAPYEVVDGSSQRLRLPAREPPSEALVDPSGGVIDVAAVRAHLGALTRSAVVHEHVYALEADPSGASVWSPTGKARFDVVVVAAGAGTSPLAAQVGIYTPTALAHHVQFSFPLDRCEVWQCWIDTPTTGLGTYQHQSGPGVWSVGGHLDPAATAWEVGRDAATTTSRETVLRYVREHLQAEPRIVDSLYCATTPDLGDGFKVRRNGSILAVYGENLFKLAPVLGGVLATACANGSTPSVQEQAAS